jgi:hypothetical protein
LFAVAVALTVSAPAVADIYPTVIHYDTLGTGGLEFAKNTAVRMVAEDLTISPEKVRVRYEFVNDTDKDVEILVAFPLPDIDTTVYFGWHGKFGNRVGISDDPENFVDFRVWADGKPVAVQTEQRAFLKTRDVTELVKGAGSPLNVVAGKGRQIFEALPEAERRQLFANGLLDDYRVPLWLLRTRFYWTQRFPAHKRVVIEHSYQPVTGRTGFSESMAKSNTPIDGVDYCFAAPATAEVEALAAARPKVVRGFLYNPLSASETAYILKTANNWNGPIGRFHLTLDKLKPENILSLCWDGELKKAGPTTFEFVRENFAPARDIHMLVVE